MSAVRCPHCQATMYPQADGTCSFCGRPTAVAPTAAAPVGDLPGAAAALPGAAAAPPSGPMPEPIRQVSGLPAAPARPAASGASSGLQSSGCLYGLLEVAGTLLSAPFQLLLDHPLLVVGMILVFVAVFLLLDLALATELAIAAGLSVGLLVLYLVVAD